MPINTKKIISDKFTELFRQKGLDKVNVRELVEAVNASKAKIAELEASKPAKEEEEEPVCEAAPAAKKCPICGAESDSKFCPQCGAPMGE